MHYDINDFLSNNNNICFKIKTPYKKDDELLLKDLYLLLSTSSLLILESIDEKSKNKCVLRYIGQLSNIEKLVDLVRDDQNLEEYDCFKIDWISHINSGYNKVICVLKEEKCNCKIISNIIIYLLIGVMAIIIAAIILIIFKQRLSVRKIEKISE